MLGLILIFFIGKYFYELAQDYYKHRWLYAILGIASYYFGAIVVGGVIVGLYIEFLTDGFIDDYSDTLLSFILFPFGIATAYVFYYFLKKRWQKEEDSSKDEIDDIGKITE